MATLLRFALSAALVCAALAAVPTFPQSYTVHEHDSLGVYQGVYVITADAYCCPPESPQCKVQTQDESGMNYVDSVSNRTLFVLDGGQGAILSVYGNVQKQYALQQNGSVWTCQDYCPMQDEAIGFFGIPANATYKGETTVNGIPVDHYQWNDTILGVIVMQINDFFVNTAVNPPQPVQNVQTLTPFGSPIGTFIASWYSFQAGVDPSVFDGIEGLDNCPMSNQCNDDARARARVRGGASFAALASQRALERRV